MSDPESPMMIVAGWKLYRRKPIAAPATTAATAAVLAWPSEAARIANVMAAMAQKPAARPSIPWMKFTMLAMATIQMIVTGERVGPRSKPAISGRVTGSIEMFPLDSGPGTAAMAIWPANLRPGGSETM